MDDTRYVHCYANTFLNTFKHCLLITDQKSATLRSISSGISLLVFKITSCIFWQIFLFFATTSLTHLVIQLLSLAKSQLKFNHLCSRIPTPELFEILFSTLESINQYHLPGLSLSEFFTEFQSQFGFMVSSLSEDYNG